MAHRAEGRDLDEPPSHGRCSQQRARRAVLADLELKAGAFRPEHTGQLNFYLSAVDSLVRGEHDNPSIGILLVKTKNRVVAEYALRHAQKPIGVAEYELVQSLPSQLEKSLPSIEQLEQELEQPTKPVARSTRPRIAAKRSDASRPRARPSPP